MKKKEKMRTHPCPECKYNRWKILLLIGLIVLIAFQLSTTEKREFYKESMKSPQYWIGVFVG